MWEFLSALAGGLVALLGSVGTTFYVQRQALKTERRTRASQAADEILVALSALRRLPCEPEMGPPHSPETLRYIEWTEQKERLIYRIEAQALLITMPALRERLNFVAEALRDEAALRNFARFNEAEARQVLGREARESVGAYLRGEALPKELQTTQRARKAIEEANESGMKSNS